MRLLFTTLATFSHRTYPYLDQILDPHLRGVGCTVRSNASWIMVPRDPLWTDTTENITFPQRRQRAVTILWIQVFIEVKGSPNPIYWLFVLFHFRFFSNAGSRLSRDFRSDLSIKPHRLFLLFFPYVFLTLFLDIPVITRRTGQQTDLQRSIRHSTHSEYSMRYYSGFSLEFVLFWGLFKNGWIVLQQMSCGVNFRGNCDLSKTVVDSFTYENFLEEMSPFCEATDTPVLKFWWRLLMVSKREWAALFALGGA